MVLTEFIDNLIRKSFIGIRLSEIRSAHPVLYKRFRSYYEKIFSLGSENGLSRYQIKAVKQFRQFVSPSMNKTVLEVGSDLDARVIIELKNSGYREVIGINPEFDECSLKEINTKLPHGCLLKKSDIRSTGLSDETVGAIFSVSVFEHLINFDLCLSEMHRLLVPGGYVYAEFGPIWSSSLGHHVYAKVDGEEARHWDPTKNPVPDHGHLLMDREAMAHYLEGRVSHPLAAEIVKWIYEKSDINRLFFEDYLRLIKNSRFELVHFDFDREFVPSDKLGQLLSKYPNYKTFDIRNVKIVIRKS